jgi:deoxyribodipyrimidine photo-lyase
VYIKKWLPEFAQFGYPEPMVEHSFARDRAISTYKSALSE